MRILRRISEIFLISQKTKNIYYLARSLDASIVPGGSRILIKVLGPAILWLDRFVMNPDRTGRNPNILCCKEGLYLIDHGAALRFQYNWSNVSEETPRYAGSMYKPHIFEMMSESSDWIYWEAQFAECITRSILEEATAEVPNSFICPLLPNSILDKSPETQKDAIQRRKAAYVAFLWKRLKSPRAFALEPPIYQKMNSSKNIRLMDR